jgi:benzil reductase ((S)-benzoin forming)
MNVLITDTGSRFGQALALEFLKTGAIVYGISPVANELVTKYVDYHGLICDLSDLNAFKSGFKAFLDGTHTIDLVILNAGIIPELNDIKNTSIEKINRVMDVNVLANKLIIDTLMEQVPSVYQVVALSSGPAVNGAPGWNAYALSKAALNTLIKLYAHEIPEIHFSAIEPGYIDGEPDEVFSRLVKESDKHISGLYGINRYGHLTHPEYAANCLVEAMGIMLQEESGSFKDISEILLAPELG